MRKNMNVSQSSKPFVFVLMPFSEDFLDYYESGIKEACKAVGVHCERVDEQRFDQTILERIYDQIQKADVVVADMSGRNPNVFYEVGYAHSLHKRVILLTQSTDDIPFDLKHHRHIVYKKQSFVLKQELEEELRWCLNTPQQNIDSLPSGFAVRRITRILAHVSKAVAGKLEMKPLLANIIEEITEILDAEVCSIFLNSEETPNRIKCLAASGFAGPIVDKAEYESGEGFTGSVFKRGQTTVINSIEDLEKLFKRKNEWEGKYDKIQWAAYGGKSQFRNGIACPLKIGDEIIGVIKVENKRTGEFTNNDINILEAITNGVLAVTFHNARLIEKSGCDFINKEKINDRHKLL